MICSKCKKSIVDEYCLWLNRGIYHLIKSSYLGAGERLCIRCGGDKFKNNLILEKLAGKSCELCIINVRKLENKE